MADFEVLPVGTREALEAVKTQFDFMADRLDDMDDAWRFMDEVAAMKATAARLEALLEQQVEPRMVVFAERGGQACWDSPDIVEDLSGNGRHLRWAEQVDLPKKGKPAVMGWDYGKEPAGPVQHVTVRGETFPVEEFDPEHRASVLELTPSMALRQSGPEEVVRLREALNEAEDFMRSMLSGDVGSEWNIGVNALLETFRAVRRPSSEGKKEEG